MKTFQLKAARAILNLGVRDIGQYIGVTGSTVSVWEAGDNKKDIPTSEENQKLLEQFFTLKNILFLDENTLSILEPEGEEVLKHPPPICNTNSHHTITRFQLRGARAILKLERKELANFVKTSPDVIVRAEKLNNLETIRPADKNLPERINRFFYQHCITFPTPTTIFLK